MLTLRPYQREAVASVYRHLREHEDNPCVVIPTAGGKTPILATICRDSVCQWRGRVLVVAHVKELLEQAVEKLRLVAPELAGQVGVYSAGLDSRDTTHSIIIAGVQSIYKRAEELGRFDLAICDESHRIPDDGEGMYQTLFAELKKTNPALRIIGLTATPFRMSTGPICKPDGILNSICYEIGVKELIAQGFICPLVTKAGLKKPDTSGLHIRGGEFIADEVEALMDTDTLVESACCEILNFTENRKACLIFASGIQHAKHIKETLEAMDAHAETIFGETPSVERDAVIKDFKEGRLKYLVNVNVLTTGFDAPNIDCVALLRPTMSPGLFYQMVGRGFRLCEGKKNCLVLDFGGNAMRHGPIDSLSIKSRGILERGEAPAKTCPGCQAVIATGYSICPECGHKFPTRDLKHDATAGEDDILSGGVRLDTYEVELVCYSIHEKHKAPPEAPKTMKVEYRVGLDHWEQEWICFEHSGYARKKAELWWRMRSNAPIPRTAAEGVYMAKQGMLAETKAIEVRTVSGERFKTITNYELGERQGDVNYKFPADESKEYEENKEEVAALKDELNWDSNPF